MKFRAALLGCSLAATPAVASAQIAPRFERAVYLPVGVNLGAAVHPSAVNGFLLGAEISGVFIDHDLRWIGGYADALHDFGTRSTRFGLGPEIGYGLFGLDGGYVGEVKSGNYYNGVTARFVLTIGFVAAYARWGHMFDDPTDRNYAEFGALVKLPLPLWEKRIERWKNDVTPPAQTQAAPQTP